MAASIVPLGNPRLEGAQVNPQEALPRLINGRLRFEACLQRAVVTASFAVEAWGPDAFLAAGRAEADVQLRHVYFSEVER